MCRISRMCRPLLGGGGEDWRAWPDREQSLPEGDPISLAEVRRIDVGNGRRDLM
jgi:hypothetical protein